MSISADALALGLDLGSAYVKAVLLDAEGRIVDKGLCRTGYDYQVGVAALVASLRTSSSVTGVTGYGRYDWPGDVQKTEISCMARAAAMLGAVDGVLVDIGGQDCKVVELQEGRARQHALNRRCAAGTGSYLEFLGFKLDMNHEDLNQLAAGTEEYHPLNSYCTVFSSTEIIDCMRNKIPLALLIRGMYASIVARIREMAPLREPLYLSGGVVEHHPVLVEVFAQLLGFPAQTLPEPQYLAAHGAALYAREC